MRERAEGLALAARPNLGSPYGIHSTALVSQIRYSHATSLSLCLRLRLLVPR